MDKPRNGETQQAAIKGKWSDASHLRSEFASELNIVRAGGHYALTFGEVRLPVLVGPVQGDIEAEIRPVVRLVVPEQAIEAMIKALNRVVENTKEGVRGK